jgi:hypothetical protein
MIHYIPLLQTIWLFLLKSDKLPKSDRIAYIPSLVQEDHIILLLLFKTYKLPSFIYNIPYSFKPKFQIVLKVIVF